MITFESFSKSIIPVFPVEEYQQWHNTQNLKFFDLNFTMWKELHRGFIQQLLDKIGNRLDGSDPDKPITADFLRFSYMVYSYHHYLDQQVRKEVELIIGGLNDVK